MLILNEYRDKKEAEAVLLGKPILDSDLLFGDLENKPLLPDTVSHAWLKLIKRLGLKYIRLHDLRHTFASLMLLRGAKPKVISEALGHASVAFTMDTYSHIIEGMQSDAMALLDEVLPVGKKGVSQKSNAKLTPEVDIILSRN
jgi:integrase